MEGLTGDYSRSELILLEYHTTDSLGTNKTKQLFRDYNLIGTPTVVFNGSSDVMPGPKTSYVYKSRINSLKEQTSTALLTANAQLGNDILVSVEITNLSTKAIENARLFVVVYEDLNTELNHYVVRDIGSAKTVTMPEHTTATFQIESGERYSSDKHVVVMLKSTGGSILQSVFVV